MMLVSLLFLVITAAQSRPAVPPRDPAAALSGRITEQASGRPFPRALVTLGAVGSSGRPWFEAVADAQGRYEFTGLEPGEYTLSAGPGELRATHLRQVFGQKGPMDLSAGPSRPTIELKPGEVLSDMDIALVRALAIEGHVFDPRDEPMAGVEVRAMRADGTRDALSSVSSDDRGEFRLFGLAPGRYRVCAVPQARFIDSPPDTSRFVRTCHLASMAESDAADIVLHAEDATGIDIRVRRSGTYSVSGSVVDAAGTLVDGAFVDAHRDDRAVSANTMTRAGRFVLKGLTPGRYLVQAGIGGPAYPSDLRPPAREREFGYTSIAIESADASGVDVLLSRAQSVTGRVLFDSRSTPPPNQLRMVVQTHAPQDAWSTRGGRPPFSAVNDKLEFELSELFRLPLIVGLQGLPEGWVVKSVRYDGRDITDVPTDFGAASAGRRLEIVLTNRVATPTVRVMDEQGAPVTSYHVVIIPADPARWKGTLWSVQGTPSRDGALKLGPRLPGDYLVAALTGDDHRVLMRDPDRIDSLASVARRVTFTEGDDRTLELQLSRLPAARQ